jgi:hypothetical protein
MNVIAIIPSHLVRRVVTVVTQRHVEKLPIGHRSERKGRKTRLEEEVQHEMSNVGNKRRSRVKFPS